MTDTHQKPVTIVIAGIGGYGYYYLKSLWDEFDPDMVQLNGVVDPFAGDSGHYPYIKANNIPVFSKMDEFYNTGLTADLAVIVSPIHFHIDQSITALANGSSVLCDKPMCASLKEADRLILKEKEHNNWVMIGYQWSFSNAILKLKQDIIKNRFGKPIRAKALCLWPRGFDYYQRNAWAGSIITDSGKPVYDSPANNAAAHFLHNLLFLTGGRMNISAWPVDLKASLYRTNKIDNFDTISCRIQTDRDTELFFHASHVTEKNHDPVFEIDCTKGRICFNRDGKGIIGIDSAGNEIPYGDPDEDQFKKLRDAVKWAGRKHSPVCGTTAARPQTESIDLIQKLSHRIDTFNSKLICESPQRDRLWVDGLYEKLMDCYEKNHIL